MNWSDLAAWSALLLTLWQQWKARHRVVVVASAPALSDGPQRTYFQVHVRNMGRPVTIERIEVEPIKPSAGGEGITRHLGPEDGPYLAMLNCTPFVRNVDTLLTDGATKDWATALSVPETLLNRAGCVEVRAVAWLSTGRSVRSKPVWFPAVFPPPSFFDGEHEPS